MELSEKRLAANRTNAQKSKGPVTPHSKRMSSRNGTKHGVLASVLLIEGESRELFANLMNGLYAEHNPVTPTEIAYVNKIGAAQWRQQRAWAIETACLTHEMQNQSAAQLSADPTTRAMLAVRSISDRTTLDLMSRYEHRFDRQQYRALQALHRLRDRQKNEKNINLPREPTLSEQNQQISEGRDPIRTISDPMK